MSCFAQGLALVPHSPALRWDVDPKYPMVVFSRGRAWG